MTSTGRQTTTPPPSPEKRRELQEQLKANTVRGLFFRAKSKLTDKQQRQIEVALIKWLPRLAAYLNGEDHGKN